MISRFLSSVWKAWVGLEPLWKFGSVSQSGGSGLNGIIAPR